MAQVKSMEFPSRISALERAHENTIKLRRSRSIRVALSRLLAFSVIFFLMVTLLMNYATIMEEQVKLTSTETKIIELTRKNENIGIKILKSKNYSDIKNKVLSSEFKDSSLTKGLAIDLNKDNFP